MKYHAVLIDPRDMRQASLVQNTSVDYLVTKFINEAYSRHKGKLAIPELFGQNAIHILDDNGKPHGMILGVANENHKKGLWVVSLDSRNMLMMYDEKGKLVSKKSL